VLKEEVLREILKYKKFSIYEILCRYSGKILKFKPKDEEKESSILEIAELEIPLLSNLSCSILFFILSLLFFILLFFFVPQIGKVFIFIVFFLIFTSFFLYYYPYLKAKSNQLRASSEMVSFITYMAISLKQVPNLEQAVFFTYQNLQGPLKRDLTRLIKKVYFQRTTQLDAGLLELAKKWEYGAKEFSEALEILITYAHNPTNPKMLEESLDLVVNQSFERMEKYSRKLKLPVMVLVNFGIIFPIISLIILPMFSIFFPNVISFSLLAFIYNLFLPFSLYLFILFVIQSRPLTTSPEIKGNVFEIKVFNFKFNVLFLIAAITLILSYFTLNNFLTLSNQHELCNSWKLNNFDSTLKPENLELDSEECKNLLVNPLVLSFSASSVLLSFFLPFTLVTFLLTLKWNKIRTKAFKVESELPEGLFKLAYSIKTGTPVELAIRKNLESFGKGELRKVLERVVKNISNLGLALEDALFHPKVGALRGYSSKLIVTIFSSIVSFAKKGSLFLSEILLTFSEYMKRLSKLQNKIEELLEDHISTLKFISHFVTPIIAGVITGLALIILGILAAISIQFQQLGTEALPESNLPSIPIPFIDVAKTSQLNPGFLELVFGLYVVEISIISAIMITGLETGYDKILELYNISKISLFSLIAFLLISNLLFMFLSGFVLSILELTM